MSTSLGIDYETDSVMEVPAPTRSLERQKAGLTEDVMSIRDQKIAGGLDFNGVRYQTRPDDRENIAGAAQLAFMAIVAGAQPGELWKRDKTGALVPFVWIAEDNSRVQMDAQTVVALGEAVAELKSECIFTASNLKARIDAASDDASLGAIDVTAGWPT